jgi:hypothetical protein
MARNDSARTSRVMAIFAARIAATWLTATAAIAAPYVPTDDAQVLERLPGGTAAQLRQLKSMQAARAAAPKDLARATELADGQHPCFARRRRSALSRLRAGGARPMVEGSRGADRGAPVARDDPAEQPSVRAGAG